MLKATQTLFRLSRLRPRLAIILGTGFGEVSRQIRAEARVSYSRLPGFPVTRVPGHAGEVLVGHLGGTPVLVLSGRAHYYEGWSMAEVTFAVGVLADYGIEALLLTNAAGAINPRFKAGDLMMISDHINFMGTNPLREERPLKARKHSAGVDATAFADLSCAYAPDLRELLAKAAKASGVSLRSGVYLAVSGPSYETPAEIRAFRRLGADAVGMSTVPEVIVARRHGIKVAAVSCLTNMAAQSTAAERLSHHNVLRTAIRSGRLAAQLLINFAMLYRSDSD